MTAGEQAKDPALARPEARGRLRTAFDLLAGACEAVVVVAIGFDLALVFSNTAARYLFGRPILWSDDASAVCLSVIAFIGGAAIYRRGTDIAFRYIVEKVDAANRHRLQALGAALVAVMAGVALAQFPHFFAGYSNRTFPVLAISEGLLAIWFGAGYLLILAFSLEKLAAIPLRSALAGAAGALLVVAAVLAWRTFYGDVLADLDPLVPMSLAVLLTFLIGVPIAFVLAAGGITFVLVTDSIPLLTLPGTLTQGISSPLLPAVPFFMIAGVLLEATGMSTSLVELFDRWVGQWRGGLLMTEVGAMYLFSGMSGSKAADIAAVGTVMRTPLRQRGYDPGESVAVLAASAAMGEIVPPSIAMLLLGSITTISIAALFLAGLIPALVLAVALCAGIALRARRAKSRLPPGHSFDLRLALRSVPSAIPAMLVPVIVIGSIVAGISTPSEGSSIAVVYGLVAAAVVYRSLRPQNLIRLLRDSALTAGMVLLILSTASLMTQAFVLDGLDRTISAFLTSTGSSIGFLLLSSATLIVLGTALEGLPALVLFGPILVPVAAHLGIDPLQFGIVLIVAMAIGVFAPPFGIGLYIACAVGGSSINQTIRASLFYTAVLLLGLLVIIAVPPITTWLPHRIGLH